MFPLESGVRLDRESERIARGGLARSTEARLRELTRWGGSSSFLGASDASVGAVAGIRPVGQLIGLAAGELMANYVPVADRWKRSFANAQDDGDLDSAARWHEHPRIVQSWEQLRARALARLVEQARRLGCHAVIGITSRRTLAPSGEGGGGEAVITFTGTAVRVAGWEQRTEPVLTLLDARELALLMQSGAEPAGIVSGMGRLEMRAAGTTIRASRWRGFRQPNVELSDLSQSVSEVRRAAMQRLRAESGRLGASGVIGIRLEWERHGAPTQPFANVIFAVFAVGSAIRVGADATCMRPSPVINLSGRRG